MAVSSSTVKGFSPNKSLIGVDSPNTLLFILGNSKTFTIGDAVRLNTSGLLVRCAAADPACLGILAGLYDQTGQIGVFSPRIAPAAITGATLTPDDTLATSSTNSTDGTRKLSGYVYVDLGDELYRNVASGALTQANVGSLFNVTSTNSGQIDQATASVTSGQFQLISLDPDGDGNTSKGLFRIAQPQLVNGFNGYGTNAVITA